VFKIPHSVLRIIITTPFPGVQTLLCARACFFFFSLVTYIIRTSQVPFNIISLYIHAFLRRPAFFIMILCDKYARAYKTQFYTSAAAKRQIVSAFHVFKTPSHHLHPLAARRREHRFEHMRPIIMVKNEVLTINNGSHSGNPVRPLLCCCMGIYI